MIEQTNCAVENGSRSRDLDEIKHNRKAAGRRHLLINEKRAAMMNGDDPRRRRSSVRMRAMMPKPSCRSLSSIPAELCPTYRPVPMLVQVAIVGAVSSALLVLMGRMGHNFDMTIPRLLSALWPFAEQHALSSSSSDVVIVPEALYFILCAALLSTLAKLIVQEAFYMPDRVTTQYLAERGELPSKLSRYRVVTPVPVSMPRRTHENEEDALLTTVPIGVHFVQYAQQQQTNEGTIIRRNSGRKSNHNKYDGIFLQHGFGANSLSWLKVLPLLVDRLGGGNARGVAHDAPGFGLTDRPDADAEGGLHQYGLENNAGIGSALMMDALSEQRGAVALLSKVEEEEDSPKEDMVADETKEANKSVAIIGHSMGSKTALLMALHHASHAELGVDPHLVVLVAPALEGLTMPSRRGYGLKAPSRIGTSNKREELDHGWTRRMASGVYRAWKRAFVDMPLHYALRRLVCGTKGFWRNGLSLLTWVDRSILSHSNVLFYQWPSVRRGWEGGVVNFVRARILSSPPVDALDDGELLRRVADLRDTKVVIIYGSKDWLVPIEGNVADTIGRELPHVKMIRLEGAGHNPFETDADGFMAELEKALE
eukprot:CAMPEP_0181099028 /NCGR_PEP_ID=MMETSP1071-20121207/12443_1 /TAXON_ID=35127 /ORGANISM="Thalassiosira sp., Strain NH16" /LENGTH=595 /DNA_ID=CAMNT_0023181667 /DNA_START=137 /DNA_END=1924 /DNA_ORIENTATION=-